MAAPTPEERRALEVEAFDFEQAVETLVTSNFAAEVANAMAKVVANWITLSARGEITPSGVGTLRRVISMLLGAIRPHLRGGLEDATMRGIRLGIKQAEKVIGELERRPDPVIRDRDLFTVVSEAEAKAKLRLEEAVRLAAALPMTSMDDVTTVVAKATSAVNGARSDARWVANRAMGQGAADAAVAAGMNLMWVPERDACLACLAYAGLVVAPGQLFPAGLTFGDKPLSLPPVPYPPLHPNCRCRAEPYEGRPLSLDMDDDAPSSALAREARRSVLRGWSDFASEPARLRAADRLVTRGAFLPKTVVARAARDVKKGKFNQRHRPLTSLNA